MNKTILLTSAKFLVLVIIFKPFHHIERYNIELDKMVFYFQKAPFGGVLSSNDDDDGWVMALAGSRLSFAGVVVAAAAAFLTDNAAAAAAGLP